MQIKNFSEYWIYHLVNHRKRLTRRLHLASFLIYIASWVPGILLWDWRYIVGSLLLGYLFASYTHTFIEKSPINLKHPYWGVIASLKMFYLMMNNNMRDEMIRVFGKEDPSCEDTFIIDLGLENTAQI